MTEIITIDEDDLTKEEALTLEMYINSGSNESKARMAPKISNLIAKKLGIKPDSVQFHGAYKMENNPFDGLAKGLVKAIEVQDRKKIMEYLLEIAITMLDIPDNIMKGALKNSTDRAVAIHKLYSHASKFCRDYNKIILDDEQA